ncbi:MAG: AtpZ/AtpI family protein [bacterium]|nr:AtpZ/AtpI family protein [bacterium]
MTFWVLEMSVANQNKNAFGEALGLAWGLGWRIAVPIVMFGLLGRFLDAKLGTSFIFLLVGIFFALGTSAYLIYRQLKDILKEEEQ